MKRTITTTILAGMWLASTPAHAALTAHFTAASLNGGCVNGDSEPVGAGDPDRYFRMAIFDEYSLNQTCADGCTDDGNAVTEDVRSLDYCTQSSGCGAWDFTNQTISKVVPPAGGVYFYYGLWDADTDADDSLGNHWFFENGPRTNQTDSNNNASPYDADAPILSTCSGRDVEGAGSANNYNLTYSVWFTDTTSAVTSLSTPTNVDDGLYDVADNDTRLDWQWLLPTDAETGIAATHFSLYDATTFTTVFNTLTAPADGAISFCPSGCDRAFTPVHGHSYRLRIRATNGNYPDISNAASTWSAWSATIAVDLQNPTSAVAAPAASGWHNGDFSADFQDDDNGAGLDSAACEWRVRSAGATSKPWSSRACNASRVVTVGAGLDCRNEGADACTIDASTEDLARRASAVGSRTFSIDWTADATGPVVVRTTLGGPVISGFTSDPDPYFSWTAATSVSPILGYSWAINASPDCGSIEVAAGDPLQVQTASGQLGEGVHQFQVRAIDVAGNCGPVSTATVSIDATADLVVNLRATNSTGAAIPAATWQPENQPTLRWDAATSTAPIAGYSYGIGALTDCTVEGAATDVPMSPLPEGATTLWVRAVDAAGKCGPPSTYTIYVDATPDSVFNLRALTQQAGMPIPASTPQPDRDPWMQWDIASSTSPIAGYAHGTGLMVDCVVDTQMPGAGLGGLPDGLTTFWVRAVDTAGNCGAPTTFDLIVADCGDGMVGPGEQCDDGNADDDDACVACRDAVCGDGAVWANTEECDDGDDNSDADPDACRADCTAAFCGDGVLDSGESCDEGAANADDASATCRSNCALATCGDGVVDTGEQCDDGLANSDSDPGACRSTCVPAYCGDGVLDGGEQCDDGDSNDDAAADACRTSCTLPTCGDGFVDGTESCDDGPANDDTAPDACRTSCVPAACGDGVVDTGEACEPGDSTNDLVCLDDCQYGGSTMDDPEPDADMGRTEDPDMGSSAPDVGAPVNGDDTGARMDESPEDMVLTEATCCAQVNSRSYSGWQVLLAGLLGLLSVRRRRSQKRDCSPT